MVVGMVMQGHSEISTDKALSTQQPVPVTMHNYMVVGMVMHGHSETSSDVSDKALSTQQPVPVTMTKLHGCWHGNAWSFRDTF